MKYIVGHLKDFKLAGEIVKILRDKQILCEVVARDSTQDFWIICVENQEDLPRAQEVYRLEMGFSPERTVSPEWRAMREVPLGYFTRLLIGLSVGTFILQKFYGSAPMIKALFISEYSRESGLLEILSGQIWRLWTPIFLHFGFLHILFNMLWLKDLGSVIEKFLGKWFFIGLILILGATSNLGQFLVAGPQFGGMSGIVYGLFSFLHIYHIFSPKSGLVLPTPDVVMMVLWFFLCLSGVIGNVANMAHGVGLGMGILMGLFHLFLFTPKEKLNRGKVFLAILCAIFFIVGTGSIEILIRG